jgi:N4-gp56 family major capsid protein
MSGLSGTSHVYGNGTTTASSGANTIVHYYDRAGIKAANAVNIYQQFASRKEMPTKMGKTYKISKFLHMYDRDQFDGSGNITADFNKYGYLSSRSLADVNAALTAASLAEGSGAVNQRLLKKITVETSLARYGEMIEYTDEVDLFSEDMVQVRYREELGMLANQRMEDLLQLDMLGTGTVMYSGVATSMATIADGVAADGSGDAAYKISYDLVRGAVRKLVRNRAKKNTSMVSGSTKISTTPVAKAYYAVIGADVKADLETLTRGVSYEKEFVFIPVHKYADAGSVAEGEVGAMHEVRFIESESAIVYRQSGAALPVDYAGSLQFTGTAPTTAAPTPADPAKFDVFPILFPTENAFATVGLKGNGKVQFNSKSPSQVELINPYGTKGFFSYNFWYSGILLEEEKMLKVLVAASK